MDGFNKMVETMKNGGGVSFVIDLTTESETIGNTELQTVQGG
jgi:hypothetical protein